MKIIFKRLIFYLILITIIVSLSIITLLYKNIPTSETQNKSQKQTQTKPPVSPTKLPLIVEPIINAKQRITKKPFGIYITPTDSPVQPERFSGYHTGTDFEITSQELTQNIVVSAVCDGKILVKQWISGYGGVIIQNCLINGEAVTVLYGHLNINENNALLVGDSVNAGEHLAILGTAYSHDTDGERKHLHLGIHKGAMIEYRGYIQNKNELSNWIDAATLL